MFKFTSVTEAAKNLSSSAEGRENSDDPFWICDLGDVKSKLTRWKELMPRIKPFYAMKSAPHKPLIKLLIESGTGVDCASQEEMDVVLGMGLNPSLIVYSNTAKQLSHILHAKKHGVNLATFDSKEELQKMKDVFPEAELLLRIKTDSKNSIFDLSERFGASLKESYNLIEMASEINMNVVGISFHVGSGCKNPEAFTTALKDSKELFDYASTVGLRFTMLDIGGGFHGSIIKSPSVEKFASVINQNLDSLFPPSDFPDLRVISEPGRYFAAEAFSLVSTIIAKQRISDNEEFSVAYVTNVGVFTSFIPKIGAPVPDMEDIYKLGGDSGRKCSKARLYGPTCANTDVLFTRLVPDMDIGDRILWRNTGAYTFSIGGKFNGFGATAFYDITTANLI